MTEPGGELVALYLSDCEQLLQRFDAAMLEADQQDALSDPAELFRLLHTLKGSSAMMDYAPLVDVTHAFENVLSGVKSRALSLQGERCRALIEAGLDFSVYFRGQLMRIRGGGAPEENKALRLRIDALTDGLGARPAPEGGAGNAPAPSETPYQTGERSVRVRLRSCPLPHIRASIIAKSVSGLCSFLATRPERLNQATEAAGAIQADGFLIRYLPAAGAADAAILQKLAA